MFYVLAFVEASLKQTETSSLGFLSQLCIHAVLKQFFTHASVLRVKCSKQRILPHIDLLKTSLSGIYVCNCCAAHAQEFPPTAEKCCVSHSVQTHRCAEHLTCVCLADASWFSNCTSVRQLFRVWNSIPADTFQMYRTWGYMKNPQNPSWKNSIKKGLFWKKIHR